MNATEANGSLTKNSTPPSAAVLLQMMQYVRPRVRDELFSASLCCIGFYLVVSLSIYEWRKTKETAKKGKHHKSFAKSVEDFLSRGFLCLLAAIFALVRSGLQQLEIRLGTSSDVACRVYQHELVELYHGSLTCLYLLLWTRQYKMYKHKALRHLGSPILRCISVLVIIGIVVSQIATATTYLIFFNLISSQFGCVYDLSTIDPETSSLPGLLLFIASFIFQFTLLGLLSYPLVKHYQIRLCCNFEEGSRGSSNDIRLTIVRLSLCTTACVLSDLVASCLLMFMHDGVTPLMFWADIYSANMLLNIVFVTLSFTDWKKRLSPCAKYEYNEVASSNTVASSCGM